MNAGDNVSTSDRTQLVLRALAGADREALAREADIDPGTLDAWCDAFVDVGRRALDDAAVPSLDADRAAGDDPFIVFRIDADGAIVESNGCARAVFGARLDQSQHPAAWEALVAPQSRNVFRRLITEDAGAAVEQSLPIIRFTDENGALRDIQCVPRSAPGGGWWIRGIDVTDRVKAMRQHQRLARYNQLLAEVNQYIAQARDEHGLLQTVCEHAVRCTDLRLAWVGWPNAEGRMMVSASAGPDAAYLDTLDISVDPAVPEGRGSVGEVWRNGEPRFGFSFADDPMLEPWRERATAFGFATTAVLPLRRDRQMMGVLVLYADELGVFDDALQAVLKQLTHDITQGLALLELRRWHRALLDHSLVGIALVRDGRFVSVNAQLPHMLGLLDKSEIEGRPLQALYADERTRDRMGNAQAELAHVGEVRLEAIRLRAGAGVNVCCDVVGAPLDERTRVWTFIDVGAREREKRQRMRIQRLYQAMMSEGEVLLQARTERAMLEETCQRLVAATIMHAVWITRPDAAGAFRILARAGQGARLLEEISISLDDADAAVTQAWRSGRTVYENNRYRTVPAGVMRSAITRHRWASILTTPVRRGGEIWALLVFVAPEPDTFTAPAIDLSERLAALLGHGLDALDDRRALEALRSAEAHRARHDELTGIPNRLALDQYLPQAIARAERLGHQLAVGMLDLDDFKPVNDRYGHGVGDLLLRELTQRLNSLMRDSDFLARIGGDEFVIVLEALEPPQAIEQIRRALDRIHQAVEIPFTLGEGWQAEVGMSLGLAMYPSDAQEPDGLLRQADVAMYQSKLRKTDRLEWWCIGEGMNQPESQAAFDPFGDEAQQLLRNVAADFEAVAEAFSRHFYAQLSQIPSIERIFKTLSQDDHAALWPAQARYFRWLLHPNTTAGAIARRSARVGRMHALVGLTGSGITQAMQIYEDFLHDHLERMTSTARNRYRLLRAANARVALDMGRQLAAMEDVSNAYNAYASRGLDTEGTWNDHVRSELNALAELPGIRAVIVLRPQFDGVFVPEFIAGNGNEEIKRVLNDPPTRPEIDARVETGRGLIGEAWRSGRVQRSDSFMQDPRTTPWQAAFHAFGFRSMLAVPVGDGAAPEMVLALLGAYPHQFASHWMQTFSTALRTRWTELARRSTFDGAPLSELRAAHYRESLMKADALQMVVQPIVDLQNGALVKVEALARLVEPDGTLTMPGEFLRAFGSTELNLLFRRGLEKSLSALDRWQRDGLAIDLSLNVAPSTLHHPDCPEWVAAALADAGVAPHRLTLELLESQDFDAARVRDTILGLERIGVQLALDDLGSGYSSLNRLASQPFDIIKIDQGIAGSIARDPLKGLTLIHSVIQIGYNFGPHVIVEGIEDDAMIEAATLLGARYGQGFGIARPMPVDALLEWTRKPDWTTASPNRLTTPLGALAFHWMSMHRGPVRHHHSLDRCPVTAFLKRAGLQATTIERLHARLHDAPDEARAKPLALALQQRLTGLVRHSGAEEGRA